jgi:adenylosuccinate synthase
MIVDIVVGGQFGSEAKGNCAVQLARKYRYRALIRVAGPNAGHTGYDYNGRKWVFRQIPVACVMDREALVVIGQGSEIDLPVLLDEIEQLHEGGVPIHDRLLIDWQATMIDDLHKTAEVGMRERLGSTAKGIGAARADRIQRTARLAKDEPALRRYMVDTARAVWGEGGFLDRVMIEGTQGYGLGLHAGYYPFCTSSDCRAIDFAAMAGMPLNGAHRIQPWLVFRTFPIRVAGNSGPLYAETGWEELGEETLGYIQPERTTVTKLIRRVGRWDHDLYEAAKLAHGATWDVLSFADYIDPSIAGYVGPIHLLLAKSPKLKDWLRGMSFDMILTGPETAAWK